MKRKTNGAEEEERCLQKDGAHGRERTGRSQIGDEDEPVRSSRGAGRVNHLLARRKKELNMFVCF